MLNFFPIFYLHCYSQVASTFRLLKTIRSNSFNWNLPAQLKRKVFVTFVVTKVQILILLITRRGVQLEHCIVHSVRMSPQNPRKSWIVIFLKKHSPRKPAFTFKRKLQYQKFPGFYGLPQHKNTLQGILIKTTNVDLENIINEFDDANVKEELRSCQHFLGDSELERARHKVFNYALKNLNEKVVNRRLDHCINNLNFAAKVNPAVGFPLKNIEDGGFIYIFYEQENNTLMHWSKLVCTGDNLAKLKHFVNKTDVMESCSWERMNTKWRFYKLTKLTVLLLYSKTYLCVAGTQSYLNHFWETAQSTVSRLKRIRENHITTTCIFLVLLLFISTEITDWNHKAETSKMFNLCMRRIDR